MNINDIDDLRKAVESPGIRLRFKNNLEKDFKRWLFHHQAPFFVLIPFTMSAIWFLFLIGDYFRINSVNTPFNGMPTMSLILGLRLSILTILIFSTLFVIRQRDKTNSFFLNLSFFIILVGTCCISNLYQFDETYLSAWFPIILIVPIFIIPSGTLLKNCLIWAGLGCATSIILNALMLSKNTGNQFTLFFAGILISYVIGLTAGYYREKLLRNTFITHKLFELSALIDPLTNIGNRRYFKQLGQAILTEARKQKGTVVFAMIDIDYFKTINDECGHSVGDSILALFAEDLKTLTFRHDVLLARLGGEEFALLWTRKSRDEVRQQLEALKAEVQNNTKYQDLLKDNPRPFSFSAGLCEASSSNHLDNLCKIADTLLYEAKQNGRNQIVSRHIDADTKSST